MEQTGQKFDEPFKWIEYKDSIATDDIHINGDEDDFIRAVIEKNPDAEGYFVKVARHSRRKDDWLVDSRGAYGKDLKDAKNVAYLEMVKMLKGLVRFELKD